MVFEGFFGHGGKRTAAEAVVSHDNYHDAYVEDAAGVLAAEVCTLLERARTDVNAQTIWNDLEYDEDVKDRLATVCDVYGLSVREDGSRILELAKKRLSPHQLH